MNMKADADDKIVVTRKPDGRVFLTHSNYTDGEEMAEFQECFFCLNGKPHLASLVINSERHLLTMQESTAVRTAIQQLAERLNEAETERDWFPYHSG